MVMFKRYFDALMAAKSEAEIDAIMKSKTDGVEINCQKGNLSLKDCERLMRLSSKLIDLMDLKVLAFD